MQHQQPEQSQQQQQDKRNLIEVTQLIDLTDQPIGLTQDQISWDHVKSTSSNCICCCCDDSVTLVTTNDSYILDHIPLESIRFAQTNASLQQIALSNHRQLVVVDLVDNNGPSQHRHSKSGRRRSTTNDFKVVNLSASGLTMDDIVFWRWLDDNTLAILSHQTLYTCQVNQLQISHHAMTAISGRSHYLGMERVFDAHPNLTELCQITDIQRDRTGNVYAISGLYTRGSLLDFENPGDSAQNGLGGHQTRRPQDRRNCDDNNNDLVGGNQQKPIIAATTTTLPAAKTTPISAAGNLRPRLLRPAFGSVPSRLSQMVSNNLGANRSLDDTVQLNLSFDARRAQQQQHNYLDERGLVQVHSKARNRSQLIGAHAVTFTSYMAPLPLQPQPQLDTEDGNHSPTILVAATRTPKQIKVHFVEMTTDENENYSNVGHNASSSIKLKGPNNHADYPTWIVCSLLDCANSVQLHVAMITTKFGRLIVCSVSHSTVLFTTSIVQGMISSSILESRTRGLMIICSDGQVLLVRLNTDRLLRLIEETKTLRHISSSHNLLSFRSNGDNQSNNTSVSSNQIVGSGNPSENTDGQSSIPLDLGLEILISTKL